MFQTRKAIKGGSAGAGNEAFLRLAGAKRSSRRARRGEEAPKGRREVETHPPPRASSTGSIRYRHISRCRTSNSRFRSTKLQSLKRSARTAGSDAHTLGHISRTLYDHGTVQARNREATLFALYNPQKTSAHCSSPAGAKDAYKRLLPQGPALIYLFILYFY